MHCVAPGDLIAWSRLHISGRNFPCQTQPKLPPKFKLGPAVICGRDLECHTAALLGIVLSSVNSFMEEGKRSSMAAQKFFTSTAPRHPRDLFNRGGGAWMDLEDHGRTVECLCRFVQRNARQAARQRLSTHKQPSVRVRTTKLTTRATFRRPEVRGPKVESRNLPPRPQGAVCDLQGKPQRRVDHRSTKPQIPQTKITK